jgi:hydrogenase maturation protein HypF
MGITDTAALTQLAGLADFFLVHNREIFHRADDAVVRIRGGKCRALRLGRGLAPLTLEVAPLLRTAAKPVLAVGGQEKNTCAVGTGRQVVVSQHIGDLSSPGALAMLASESKHIAELLRVTPEAAVCDLHPDYQSYARAFCQFRARSARSRAGDCL